MNSAPELPLRGKRVLLTRPAAQSETLVNLLRDFGASVRLLPCIEIVPVDENDSQLREIIQAAPFDWILFTSGNAAETFHDKLTRYHLALPESVRIAAIGSSTARTAESCGFFVHFTAEARNAAVFAERFLQTHTSARHVLYPASALAQARMQTILAESGVTVTRIDIYTSQPVVTRAQVLAGLKNKPDFIVFFSPSAVDAFMTQATQSNRLDPAVTRCVAIGQTTAAALQARGVARPLIAAEPTNAAVAACLLQQVQVPQTAPEAPPAS